MTEQAPYDVRGEPFPTTYYVTCPHLVAAIARLEAAGGVERWSEAAERRRGSRRVARAGDGGAAARPARAGRRRRRARTTGLRSSSGSAGSRTPEHLKCLHAHVAFALARSALRARRADPRGGRAAVAGRPVLLRARSVKVTNLLARVGRAPKARSSEWEQAYRSSADVTDPALEERLARQVEAITAELRRRVGGDLHDRRARGRVRASLTSGRATSSPSRARGSGRGRSRSSRARRSTCTRAAQWTTTRDDARTQPARCAARNATPAAVHSRRPSRPRGAVRVPSRHRVCADPRRPAAARVATRRSCAR